MVLLVPCCCMVVSAAWNMPEMMLAMLGSICVGGLWGRFGKPYGCAVGSGRYPHCWNQLSTGVCGVVWVCHPPHGAGSSCA